MQDITYQESSIKPAALTQLLTVYSCVCTQLPVLLNAARAHQFKVHANSKAVMNMLKDYKKAKNFLFPLSPKISKGIV